MLDTLIFSCEVDGSEAELFIEFRTNFFGGKSSAWFSIGALNEFIEKLAAYPLSDASPLELRGGIWDVSGSHVVQDLESFSVKPFGARGQISVEIRLTNLNDFGGVKFSAFGSFVVSYQEIDQIRSAFKRVIGDPQSCASVQLQDYA
jgi:hypothetical protein